MKKNFLIAAVLMLVSALASASKVAVVDMERALFQSNGAKASFKQVEEQFGDDLVKIKALEKEALESQQKLKNDGAIMSDEERRKITNEIKEKQKDFQHFAGKLQQAEQAWRQQFFRANAPRLQAILKELVEEEKVDVVLNGQAVIHVTPDLDLTKKLLNKLNQATAAKQ